MCHSPEYLLFWRVSVRRKTPITTHAYSWVRTRELLLSTPYKFSNQELTPKNYLVSAESPLLPFTISKGYWGTILPNPPRTLTGSEQK